MYRVFQQLVALQPVRVARRELLRGHPLGPAEGAPPVGPVLVELRGCHVKGQSDLLAVNLREQQAAAAQALEVAALLAYFISQADYRATLASE